MLLWNWRSELESPAQFLSLTPEDRLERFFLHRLLKDWPAIRARYEELVDMGASWGGLLGMAIAEIHPDFCLLLDDFQEIEASPVESELLALFRHFPVGGTLVVASRHQLPRIKGRSVLSWGPGELGFPEEPRSEDLRELPEPLLAKTLAMFLVGEGDPSSDGWDLVRRNLATSDDPLVLRLRTCWSKAAAEMLFGNLPEETWDRVVVELESFVRRHYRTEREQLVPKILERLPTEVRRNHPYFLQLEGDLLAESGWCEEAQACYEHAIALVPKSPELLADLQIRSAKVALLVGDLERSWVGLGSLEGFKQTSRQEAAIQNTLGYLHWYRRDSESALSAWLRVLAIPALGSRHILHEQYSALNSLAMAYSELGVASQVERYLEQMISLVQDYELARDQLEAHVTRLSFKILAAEDPQIMLDPFVSIPNPSFRYPNPSGIYQYLYLLGVRLQYKQEHALAAGILEQAKSMATTYDHPYQVQVINLALLRGCLHLGSFEAAKGLYGELSRASAFSSLRFNAQLLWLQILAESGRTKEANDLLGVLAALDLNDYQRQNVEFHRLWIQHGTAAVESIRALLAPDHPLYRAETRKLQQLGLCTPPPVLKIHAFGEFAVCCNEDSPIRWPRKKPLVMLAYLLLNREGLSSEALADSLFGDPEDLESLHTLAYRLRQNLKTVGGEELLESIGGTYRLRWEKIAYCDLFEFHAFYQKAKSLEEEGLERAASMYYGLALGISKGGLFENIPEEFKEERSAIEEKIRQASAYLRTHPFTN